MEGNLKSFMTTAEFMFERLPETWDYSCCHSAKARLYLCVPWFKWNVTYWTIKSSL